MNRKQKEKENDNRIQIQNIKYIEPIQPKFNGNWTTNVRMDRIYVNIAGK